MTSNKTVELKFIIKWVCFETGWLGVHTSRVAHWSLIPMAGL